jgi:hypothetical protein
MRAFTAVIAASIAVAASPAQAWWDNGHMLVGEIASQLLTAKDRSTLETVLADWDRSFPNTKTISTAAIWPDLIKCSKGSASCTSPLLPSFSAMDNWHYMNLPLNANGTQWGSGTPDLKLFKQSFGGLATDIVDALVKTFTTTQSLWSANLALRQLIHIIADVHQPLHAITAVSEKYPGGDQGGNLYVFKSPCASSNLHALYDAAGGELTTNWALTMDKTRPLIEKNATDMIATIPSLKDGIDLASLQSLVYPEFVSAFSSGSYFKQIVLESYQIATSVVYPGIDKTFDGASVACPSPKYFDQAKTLSKQRITLAGKRLAVVLTKIAQQVRATKLVDSVDQKA